ncbi:MAG: 30S ribosomal protein S20 [Planctomycetota bacterium]|jgi:small subunit ribosomal protein S20|nr:30S ribosomal protein S20 [Planctomycetota bacterium]
MPQGRSKLKTLRKNEAKREKNRAARSALRTEIKKAKAAIEENSEGLADQIRETAGKLDRAAQKNLIHRKKAARIKSSLAKAAANAGS